LSGGKLQPVLDSLKVYRDSGVWLEITNLVVPTWTDNLDEIRKMCIWLRDNGFGKVPIHFSRFFPLYKLEQLPPTPMDILFKAARIATEEGLVYVYTGNSPGNEISDTKCPSCKTTLIVRQGFRVVSNTLKNGKCDKCGRTIEGIWS
jgi:pyruvate formate lyase activating enzyme